MTFRGTPTVGQADTQCGTDTRDPLFFSHVCPFHMCAPPHTTFSHACARLVLVSTGLRMPAVAVVDGVTVPSPLLEAYASQALDVPVIFSSMAQECGAAPGGHVGL